MVGMFQDLKETVTADQGNIMNPKYKMHEKQPFKASQTIIQFTKTKSTI